MGTRTIRIFLASSAELAEHRNAFELQVRQLDDRWLPRGLHCVFRAIPDTVPL